MMLSVSQAHEDQEVRPVLRATRGLLAPLVHKEQQEHRDRPEERLVHKGRQEPQALQVLWAQPALKVRQAFREQLGPQELQVHREQLGLQELQEHKEQQEHKDQQAQWV